MQSFDLESLSLQSFLQSLHKEQWQEVRLGEVAEIIGGGTPKTSIPEYWNGEIPWLTPKDLAGYNHIYISKGERFITKLGLKNSSATLMPKGAILLSSRAPIGYVAIAQNDICTNQGFKSLVVEPKQACNLFVYYWIKNNVEYLQSLGTGTTFEEISKGVVQDITIPLPPLTIQQKIAEILSSFDDKIDLLHRQNKTLESLALTLFRHYFIDNPNRNEWELGKLGDYVKIASGKPLEKRFYNENGCYEILGANGAVGKTNKFLCDEKLIYTGRVGTLGKIFLIDYPRKVWLSDNTLIFRTNDSSLYFVYFLLQDLKLENYDVGSTQPLIRQGDLLQIQIQKPNNDLILKFNEQAKTYFEKISHNTKQIQNLQAMRDMLLKAIFA